MAQPCEAVMAGVPGPGVSGWPVRGRPLIPTIGGPSSQTGTSRAVWQRKRPSESSRPAERRLIRAGKTLLRWKLAGLAALASPAFALFLLVYLQSEPKTAGVSLAGPFDGERVFTDLKELVAFGPRPSGSQALERCRAVHRQQAPPGKRQRCCRQLCRDHPNRPNPNDQCRRDDAGR